MERHVLVVEVSNSNDQQIQEGLGQAFNDFCAKYKGTGITASVLEENAAIKVKEFIEEEN